MSLAQHHYWLTGYVDDNRFLIYGGPTEDQARQHGLEVLSGVDFEIVKLPTRHQPTASRMLKGRVLDATGDIRGATKHLRHKRLRRNF